MNQNIVQPIFTTPKIENVGPTFSNLIPFFSFGHLPAKISVDSFFAF